MSDPIPFKPADGEKTVERRQLAEGAQNLLEDKAFTASILSLRKRFFERLMAAETPESKIALIERIRALESIPQELQILVNDEKVAQMRKR